MSQPAVPDLVPVRMVNEFVYCPRLFYLEWVQCEWADNFFTEDGKQVHRRADRETRAGLPEPDRVGERDFAVRSVALSSGRLGLTTRMDVVEGDAGEVIPIDYKRGKPPRRPERAHDPERVQVCAQALILRDNGYAVPHAEIYFAGSRERVRVDLTDDLIRATVQAAEDLRLAAAAEGAPPPLVDSPKCDGCSLVGICLPDEVNDLRRPEAAKSRKQGTRRLHPSRDDALPLYVQRGGTKLGVQGDVLIVRHDGEKQGESRLEHTSQVSVYGGVQVSTQALRKLMQRDIPLLVFSAGGWFYGLARGLGSKNVELRQAQFRAADRPQTCLDLARGFVSGKVSNQRTLLRRNHAKPGKALRRLAELRAQAREADGVEGLLGIEGTAARIYFQALPGMLKTELGEFSFERRSRRPPADPVNAMLSFVYAILTKDWTVTCASVGLDPYLGFFHRPRYGRPSLALDLMEEFRPIVADSVVVNAVNNGVLGPRDFVKRGPGVSLTSAGRKRLIGVYERRVDELVTHPVFGYRISYRRVFEVQARLLGRYLTGEIEEYPRFTTR